MITVITNKLTVSSWIKIYYTLLNASTTTMKFFFTVLKTQVVEIMHDTEESDLHGQISYY